MFILDESHSVSNSDLKLLSCGSLLLFVSKLEVVNVSVACETFSFLPTFEFDANKRFSKSPSS